MQEVIVLYNPIKEMYVAGLGNYYPNRHIMWNVLPQNALLFDPAGDWPRIKKRFDAITGIDLIPKTIKV